MKVVVLVGGVGGARFLLGLKAALGRGGHDITAPDITAHDVTAVVNTGDDIWLHGVRICPDLDTCMYTLGGGIDTERGWGRAGETWAVKAELARYGADPEWFGLGDLDLATHLVRTRMLQAGYPLSTVTAALCDRWRPGVRLLPATDDRCETHVVVTDDRGGAEPGGRQPGGGLQIQGRRAMHFQEWWIRHHAALPASEFVLVGADTAEPAAGVLDAIAAADAVLLAPSNPVVSIGSVLAVPGIRHALRSASARVVGLSPIVGGRAVRGMAEACLAAIGVPCEAGAVAAHYGARSAGGVLDGWLVHTGDRATVPGVEVREIPLLMTDVAATAAMATAALDLALSQ